MPGGMLLGWGLLAPARPRLLARKPPSRGSDKSHLLGASPLFFHP